MYIISCRSSVVEEAPVARPLPPARGLLLGRGAGMLKKSTLTIKGLFDLLRIARFNNNRSKQ